MRKFLKPFGGPYGSRTRLSRLKKARVLNHLNTLGSPEVKNRIKRYQCLIWRLPNRRLTRESLRNGAPDSDAPRHIA
jgi:hypothetical protein